MKSKLNLSLLLGLIVMTVSACSNNIPKDTYSYDCEDIQMSECLLDINQLKEVKPSVKEVVKSTDYISGYLMDSIENNLGKGNFFFWLGKPKTEMPEKGYPAILLIHGGGGNAFEEWVEFWNKKGYVALAIDINGQMYDEQFNLKKNPNFLVNGSWGSVACGVDQDSFRSSWTGVNLTNCILSNNYLRSLDFVNKDKVVVTGISWGGYMTCILSGVDKRFTAFAPVYGCGYIHTDSWGLSTAGLSSLSEENRLKWAKVYDPSSYLKYATKPMLFVAGLDDPAYSSISRYKSTLNIPGKHFYCYSLALSHGHYFNLTPCVDDFFDKVFNSKKFDEKIIDYSLKDNKLLIEVSSDIKIDLCYTYSSEENSHEWIWEFEENDLVKGKNYFDIDDSVTAVMISFYEEGLAPVYSTNLILNKDITDLR